MLLGAAAQATTVTGEVAVNYAGLGDVSPYTNASFTYVQGGGRIVSGVFRAISGAAPNVAHRYNGAMGTGVIKAKFEYSSATGSDICGVAIIDSSGDGYVLVANGATLFINRVAALSPVDFLDSAVEAPSSGDRYELWYDPATDTLTAYKNTVLISGLTATDSTVTAGLSFSNLVIYDTTGTAAIISFAGDGIAAASGDLLLRRRRSN